MKTRIFAAIAAAVALVGFGCNDHRATTNEGTGGSGYTAPAPAVNENNYENNNPGDDNQRLGDGKIGENNGVLDDGEGPLEGNGVSDDKMGQEPGVWNDGEGPIEDGPLNRESDSGKSLNQ